MSTLFNLQTNECLSTAVHQYKLSVAAESDFLFLLDPVIYRFSRNISVIVSFLAGRQRSSVQKDRFFKRKRHSYSFGLIVSAHSRLGSEWNLLPDV